jgi:hypothetical protein
MQPVRTHKNQYRGINAHLHSLWQAEEGWADFHGPHITDIYRDMNRKLLPMGYIAHVERSMQIRRWDDMPVRPRSDILIRDTQPERGRQPAPAVLAEPAHSTVADLLLATEDSEKPWRAIAIYRGERRQADTPVAWLEILSPTNKRPGADRRDYIAKRQNLLDAGVVFVEIDYLHEYPSTFRSLLDYTRPDERDEAHPYHIVMLDPRPDIWTGPAVNNGFNVDDPIPPLTITLLENDQLTIDFDELYQNSFEAGFYGDHYIDYAALPVHFDRYSPADQARIARRMLAVLAASETERSTPPLPVQKDLPLEEALGQIAALTAN